MDKEEFVRQLIKNLLYIQKRLRNTIIKNCINNNLLDFDYETFLSIVNNYLVKQEYLFSIDAPKLKELEQALKIFISSIESEAHIINYKIELTDSVITIQDFYNEELNTKQIPVYPDKIYSTMIISEEEFSKRYDNLVNLLNDSVENSNLTLYTKSENKPFKLCRNGNNSITAVIGSGDENKISLTKERLINTIYKVQEYPHHKSYADVVIERILDNSIFDKIENKHNSSKIVDESLNKKISELENKNYELIGQISELKNMYEKRENEFSQVSEVLEKSKTLESEFENAKEAVLKNIELKQATTYWEEQAEKYDKKYKFYFKTNIGIGVALIIITFLLINFTGLFITNISDSADKKITETISQIAHSASFFNYIIFIMFTTIMVWMMKILVKIMLSNYHLAVDANERVIMINTYLVLLEDGKGFEENDRKVILDNIFRQTNHGIIKDETSVTVADIVSSFKK